MDLNDVTLLGTLARAPRAETPNERSPFTSCAVRIGERGRDGQTYYTYIPFDAYGKAAVTLSGLAPDATVLLRCKLTWQRDPTKQTKGALRVIAWSITVDMPSDNSRVNQTKVRKPP